MTPSPTPPPRLLPLLWPLFLEMGLGIAVGWVGTAFAASVSDIAAAAYGLAQNVAAMIFMLLRVIGAGISVVITQSLGGGQRAMADAVAKTCLAASTWLGLALGAVCGLGASGLMQVMNAPDDVHPVAVLVLYWMVPALCLDAWLAVVGSVLRAHLRARETLVLNIGMQVVFLLLAWAAMRLWSGTDALVGMVLALAVSRALGLMVGCDLWRRCLGMRWHWRDWWHVNLDALRPVCAIGLPGAAENVVYRVAYMVSISAAGHLGTQALATQAYVLQLNYAVLLFGLATGLSAEIVVGHLIGAGHWQQANRVVKRALGRGLLVSVLAAVVFAWLGRPLLGLFTSDPVIVNAGLTLLWLTVVLEPGRTFNLVVINALRATGDARYPVVAGALSMLIVLAGGAWWLAVVCEWGLPGVWVAYAADEWVRGLLMWHRWTHLKWVPHARRMRRRLRAGLNVAATAAGH